MAKQQKSKKRRDEHRKKEKKTKKDKKKKKHSSHKYQRSSSQSYNSSSSHHSSSHDNHTPQKPPNITLTPSQIQATKPICTPEPIRKHRVNINLLTNIISDHKKMNRNLDAEQTSRAATKFKQNFTEEIKPITMSAFLSNEALQRKVSSKQFKGLVQCSICEVTFQESSELEEHMHSH